MFVTRRQHNLSLANAHSRIDYALSRAADDRDRIRNLEARVETTGVSLYLFDIVLGCGRTVQCTALTAAAALEKGQAFAEIDGHDQVVVSVTRRSDTPVDLC